MISNLLIHWNVHQCKMKENDSTRRKKQKRGHHRGSVDRRQQQHDTKHDDEELMPWSEKLLHWTMNELSIFATDAERRDLVCIGASVGFAASFGAPIGGLLFILDDVSCYFERHLLLRMLVANAIGTFCLALKNRDLSNYSIINMGSYNTEDIFLNRLDEVPLYIMVGVGGGVLGGLFSAGYIWLRRNITSKFMGREDRTKWQLCEVAVVSILTSIALFYIPTVSWACKQIPLPDASSYDVTAFNGNVTAAIESYYQEKEQDEFFCHEGQINEMAKVAFGSRIDAIRDILQDPSAYQQKTLVTLGIVFYVLTLITFGTAIPAGLFTPTVLVGAALGGACGNAFQEYVDEEISPSTFALLGVAALLAGIQRSTVSVAVILVEGTGQIRALTPVIVVVIIAKFVAQCISKDGIFEAVIEYKQYPYLEHENLNLLRGVYEVVQVKDIMSEPPLLSLAPHERVGDLVELLNNSSHNGFPVLESGTRRFLGLVKRTQIAALLETGVFSRQRFIRGEKDLVAATFGVRVRRDDYISEGPLMHYAYAINDDRYDHILSAMPEEESPAERAELNRRMSSVTLTSSIRNTDDDEEASIKRAHFLLTKEQEDINKSIRLSLMPTPTRNPSLSSSSSFSLPSELCTVTRNSKGCIVVSWHNTEYDDYWVDLAAVANRGTYTVSEFCPVSKAYTLFTSLGLRHIVVLGGSSGGEVVGVLTRASFLESHIEKESGL